MDNWVEGRDSRAGANSGSGTGRDSDLDVGKDPIFFSFRNQKRPQFLIIQRSDVLLLFRKEIRKFSTETRSTTGNHAAAANAASASASASASFFELAFLPAVGEEAPEQAREYARLDLAAARQWPPRVVLVLALHFRGCCSSLAQKSSKAGKRNPELQMEAGCRVGN
ncbi:hypothetical protein GUJ93_ZPchr0003g17907 [Zizania palustris]|uniref:Uncharacterized protein n=1 Tax=Zizania palustris TaxID=103762 RepID=A0A8J5VEU7_ZIZPA|nr:hypothetical protein GUJ93_ZPchr0003g17907 [Zizania palustris]